MGGLLEWMWRILYKAPPIYAWRLLHGIRPEVLDIVGFVHGRPNGNNIYNRLFLGYRLENPIGIAAGLDKDASLMWIAWAMGAGFHVVGSVLPHPYSGVEPKVLVRLPNGGTINRLGLPSKGVDYVVDRLKYSKPPGMPIAVSIASFTPKGYRIVYDKISPYSSWVEVNISCPNVEDHSTFEDPNSIYTICSYLKQDRTPILLKIPHVRDEDILLEYLKVAVDCGYSGIVAGNTMKINYGGVNAGLGGPSLFKYTVNMVRTLRLRAPEGFKIIGVGGVDSGYRVRTLLDAGADLVEVLSAVINRGPYIISRIIGELSR